MAEQNIGDEWVVDVFPDHSIESRKQELAQAFLAASHNHLVPTVQSPISLICDANE